MLLYTPIASRNLVCCETEARELAVTSPLAATAGIPMPGNTESPQQNSPSTGVEGIGNKPFPALIAGPYVPRFRRRKRSCVRGVPTSLTSHFSREKPGPSAFSTALHRTCSQQKPAFRSDLLKLTPKYYYPESRYTPIVATSKLAKSWVFQCQAPRYLHSKAYDGWFHNLSSLWQSQTMASSDY